MLLLFFLISKVKERTLEKNYRLHYLSDLHMKTALEQRGCFLPDGHQAHKGKSLVPLGPAVEGRDFPSGILLCIKN